jgi:hypothetical protein
MRQCLLLVLALTVTACGGNGHSVRPATHRPAAATPPPLTTWVGCGNRGLVRAPLAQEPGVYRAGPLTLVLGQDPAQFTSGQLHGEFAGSKAIAVVHGHRPVLLTVDPGSRARLQLQFDARLGRLAEAALFPACGKRVYRTLGGLNFTGMGCVGLHASVGGRAAATVIPMLIVLGNTLRGCPAVASLPPGAVGQVTVGVACPVPNSVRCDRLGVGVKAPGPATLVTASVDGRLVTLNPPDAPGDLWQSYLYDAGLRREGGPLNTHAHDGHWIGDPPVIIRVRVTVFRPDGSAGAVSETMDLHPGFG